MPKYTQIGNAVPVKLGRELGKHIATILSNATLPSVRKHAQFCQHQRPGNTRVFRNHGFEVSFLDTRLPLETIIDATQISALF